MWGAHTAGCTWWTHQDPQNQSSGIIEVHQVRATVGSARISRVWGSWQLGCWVLSRWDDVQVATRRSPRKRWWYIVIARYKETIVMNANKEEQEVDWIVG
jgi:hypothetical protein